LGPSQFVALFLGRRTSGLWTRTGKRFVVHADEKLTAFLELEAAIRVLGDASHEN
jgi:hypothetical protein